MCSTIADMEGCLTSVDQQVLDTHDRIFVWSGADVCGKEFEPVREACLRIFSVDAANRYPAAAVVFLKVTPINGHFVSTRGDEMGDAFSTRTSSDTLENLFYVFEWNNPKRWRIPRSFTRPMISELTTSIPINTRPDVS